MGERYLDDEDRPLSGLRDHLRDVETAAASSTSPRKPLVNQVSNAWRGQKQAYEGYERELGSWDSEDEKSCSSLTRNVVSSRRFRKMFLVCLLLIGLAFWFWKWYLLPQWEMEQGFTTKQNGTFGIAKGGDFDGTWLQDLDPKYLPGGYHDPKGKRRLVFVGDIHGCVDELKKLLKQVQFNEETDHLVAVGDVVSKGPDSPGVVDELIRLRASSVRGNHEDRILAIAPSVLETDIIPSAEMSSDGASKDAKLLRQLSKNHIEYLRNMPLMIRIPALPMATESSHKSRSPLAEELIVVHAGLVPAVPLEKQDPYFVMNMRAIKTESHLPLAEAATKKSKSQPWHDIWSWYNDRLFRKKPVKDFRIWEELDDLSTSDWDSWLGTLGLKDNKKWPDPQVVIYGHHSKAGLKLDRWSKGLDTGCVRGGELTALVLDAKGTWTISSVGCKDQR